MEKQKTEAGRKIPSPQITLENQKIRGRFANLKDIAMLVLELGAGAVIIRGGIATGKLIEDKINESKIRKAFETAVVKYADFNEDGDVSDKERDGLYKMVLRSAGMTYENGVLNYSNGKRASLDELRNAIESYKPGF